jgi:hypothetical protein
MSLFPRIILIFVVEAVCVAFRNRLECVPSLVIFDGELVPKQEAGLAVRSCAMRVAE